MTLEYFLSNRQNPTLLIPKIKEAWKGYFEWEAFKQYNPRFHEILNPVHRKDKIIQVPSPGCGIDNEGNPLTEAKIVKLNRIPLALQKLIVSRGSAFLTGGKVSLKAKSANDKEQQTFEGVNSAWNDNKLQFKNSDIAKRFMSETECAEIWYTKKNPDNTTELKVKIYSPSKGFTLTPVFDSYGDLIAFGLGFMETIDGKEIEHMDLYDDKLLTRYILKEGGWELIESIVLVYGKIPVIYYSLEQAIWADVQWAIERLETLISNLGDQNDYTGSPILAASGEIKGFSAKGEAGKVIELGEGADIKYVVSDQAPESVKMEIEKLLDFVFTITQTPNISFDQMKGLGDISGAAFDRMMIDGHLKATDLQNGMYGECIQRRLNFLKAAYIATNPKLQLESASKMTINAEFSLFSIDSIADNITNAKNANGGLPVLSQEESISRFGISDDPAATYAAIQKQAKQTIVPIQTPA